MMHKVLIRLVVYDVLEWLGRLSLILDEVENQHPEHIPPAVLQHFRNRLLQCQTRLFEDKKMIHHLFSEGEGSGSGSSGSAKERVEFQGVLETLGQVKAYVAEVTSWLRRLGVGTVRDEVRSFLRFTVPLNLLANIQDRLVLLNPEGSIAGVEFSATGDQEPFKGVITEQFSLLQQQNPLAWVGLGEDYAQQLALTHKRKFQVPGAPAKGSKKSADAAPVDNDLLNRVAKAVIQVRLFGPASYYHQLVTALHQGDLVFFQTLEPLLFQSLNYANFTDKTLVILHEAAERFEPLWSGKQKASKETAQAPLQEGLTEYVNSIHRTLEADLPQRLLFSDKQFQRALQLQDRIGQEVMLSASAQYGITDVREAIHERFGDEEANTPPAVHKDSKAIYQLLGMVSEDPHSPLEMINGAWVHRVNRAPAWLYDTLQGAFGEAPEGFERLTQRIARQDSLLLKSIETAEVHRVLLGVSPV